MTEAEYNKLDGVRCSRLKALRVSPKYYRHQLTAEREETPAMRVGHAAHCRILEPEHFGARYACFDGIRRGRAYDDFRLEHAGKSILSPEEHRRAIGMSNAVLLHPLASDYLDGVKEQVIVWTDSATGMRCKARVDCAGKHLVDIKTTADANPRVFANQAARMGYHLQMAMYLDGCLASGYEVSPEPIIISVESDEPFDVVVYALLDDTVAAGRAEYRRLLRLLKECHEKDVWPGMAPGLQVLTLPAWADESAIAPYLETADPWSL